MDQLEERLASSSSSLCANHWLRSMLRYTPQQAVLQLSPLPYSTAAYILDSPGMNIVLITFVPLSLPVGQWQRLGPPLWATFAVMFRASRSPIALLPQYPRLSFSTTYLMKEEVFSVMCLVTHLFIVGSYAWFVLNTASFIAKPLLNDFFVEGSVKLTPSSRASLSANQAVQSLMVSTTKTGASLVARSAALATMWFMPKVFSVVCQIFLASAKLCAFMRMYLRRSVHWKPSSVSFMESRPASWTVSPAWDIPVSAPMIPGQPTVAWGIVPLTFQTKMILLLLMPVLASQSRFRMVQSFPPLVLLPQVAINEQWIRFLVMNLLIIFTTPNRLFSTQFSSFGFFIFNSCCRKTSTIANAMSVPKSPGQEETTRTRWMRFLILLRLWLLNPPFWMPLSSSLNSVGIF